MIDQRVNELIKMGNDYREKKRYELSQEYYLTSVNLLFNLKNIFESTIQDNLKIKNNKYIKKNYLSLSNILYKISDGYRAAAQVGMNIAMKKSMAQIGKPSYSQSSTEKNIYDFSTKYIEQSEKFYQSAKSYEDNSKKL